jgi:hypothetical protein
MDFTRIPLNEEQAEVVRKKVAEGGNSWLPYDNGYIPTADEVNTWSMQGMGHDSLNTHICIEARCQREGLPFLCLACGGAGHSWSEGMEEKYENWRRTEPPAGEGYQLWETTSEGSPQSPVFATLDELCAWCETNATTFADFKTTKEKWKEMLETDRVAHIEGNVVFL